MRFIVKDEQAIWVHEFYAVEVENPDSDAATQRDQAEEAYYNGEYDYLGYTLQDSVDFLERGIKSIEAMPDGLPFMAHPAGDRDRVKALVDAAQLCVEALKDHPQYDNQCEPSLEAEALDAVREALKPFQPAKQADKPEPVIGNRYCVIPSDDDE